MLNLLSLFILILPSVIFSQCPYAHTALNGGTLCSQTTYCQALGGSGYECMNGQCCRINGLCNVDEVKIGFECYKMSSEGGRCVSSAQCQPNGSMQCLSGICRRNNDYENPICQNANQQAERENGRVKDCMYSACSVGFGCEYSIQAGHYICCGNYNAGNDYNYGKARMYPGTSMPLQCFRTSQCLFDDTPNCVFSQRYKHYVCCSTFNC